MKLNLITESIKIKSIIEFTDGFKKGNLGYVSSKNSDGSYEVFYVNKSGNEYVKTFIPRDVKSSEITKTNVKLNLPLVEQKNSSK